MMTDPWKVFTRLQSERVVMTWRSTRETWAEQSFRVDRTLSMKSERTVGFGVVNNPGKLLRQYKSEWVVRARRSARRTLHSAIVEGKVNIGCNI